MTFYKRIYRKYKQEGIAGVGKAIRRRLWPPGYFKHLSASTNEKYRITPKIAYIGGESSTPGFIYRCTRYSAAAAAAGADVFFMSLEEAPRHLPEIENADIVVIWRALYSKKQTRKVISSVRKGKGKIIFDIDDLLIEPDLAKISIIDGIRSKKQKEEKFHSFFENMRKTAMEADYCTSPTPALTRRLECLNMPVFTLLNGFDDESFISSRLAARKRGFENQDGLFRLGYAGGSKTHQRDFSFAAAAVARILREFPQARLVLFYDLLAVSEFPALAGLENQIEWRNYVPLEQLPGELARFDVSLAPLEVGNPYCESKSELKFFESALVGVCTVASPTEPFRNAIVHGETGFLAESEEDWYKAIKQLISSDDLRREISKTALRSVLRPFGFQRRVEAVSDLIDLVLGDKPALTPETGNQKARVSKPVIPEHEVVFLKDTLGRSYITAVLHLCDNENELAEAMDAVKNQTLSKIDLVIVDNKSGDTLGLIVKWAEANSGLYNRLIVASSRERLKPGFALNIGFELAETPYVFTLDPHSVAGNIGTVLMAKSTWAEMDGFKGVI